MNPIAAWRTNNRVTTELIQQLPRELWDVRAAGTTRTVRAIAAHLHNARCMWIKTLGREHGIAAPARVDHHRVTARQLVAARRLVAERRATRALAGLPRARPTLPAGLARLLPR